ncbi:phosphatidate cytidylyltransferase, putative [Plasmodium ovale]|uniref:dolichol kinase n=1 Tax=Plasmodium ovale TaxID=36330 RepID=A0A1D3KWG4_PLAOA|nr:phosphatidate cytidylyltransferase, putative [Plasmodium ovale]
MINIVLTFLITITEVKKKVFLSSNYTYKWLVLTLLCNMLIVIWLYYDKRNNIRKGQLKWKSNFLFDTSTFALGGYYKKERLPNSPKGKNMNMIINLYEKDAITIFQLFIYTYIDNIFSFFFLPFLSTLLLRVAKLTLALINEFALSSVWLRYARVRIPAYVAFHAVLFPITISALKISENVVTYLFCFATNFSFYHVFLNSSFHLTNRVFSFLESVMISVVGTLALNCSLYSLIYDYLNGKIIPGILFIFFSKTVISLVLYGMCCTYCLQSKVRINEKLFVSSLIFFAYSIYNLVWGKHDSAGTNGLQVIMRVILWEKNSTLIISWFAITVFYLFYINNLKRDNKRLPYFRKHYHFLLFLNVCLSFVSRKVELLTFTLTALFLFFILVEIVRKVCEYVFVSSNVVNTFITRFTDDRDRQGLVVTHIYLLAGVYIPIIIDVLFNNKNYVQTKGVFSYFFREANFNLYSSSLNAICIGDSFAAIGGLLFPIPKMKHTNNKSIAGFLFFFCTTLASLLLCCYLFHEVNLTSFYASFMVSLFGALFEAYLLDIDNLLLPIFTFCVYLSFEI